MPWNPEVYDQFKQERSAPFFDLLKITTAKSGLSIIDLGCGTGELTAQLSKYFEGSQILGIDSSSEMLQKAEKFENQNLRFVQRTIEEQLESDEKFDLIFANASIQWCGDHQSLFPKIISKISKNGQLAVQVPSNHEYIVHRLLQKIAETEPYKTAFNNWRRQYSVLKIEEYAKILFESGGSEIHVLEKVYPHLLENAEAVFQWASGTAMLPYLERLPENLRENFKKDYQLKLQNIFPETPVFYPFKRTFIYAKF